MPKSKRLSPKKHKITRGRASRRRRSVEETPAGPVYVLLVRYHDKKGRWARFSKTRKLRPLFFLKSTRTGQIEKSFAIKPLPLRRRKRPVKPTSIKRRLNALFGPQQVRVKGKDILLPKRVRFKKDRVFIISPPVTPDKKRRALWLKSAKKRIKKYPERV